MKPIEFGEYLKELRMKKKLTMRQLDTYSGVSHSYISQMERGERGVPSPDILRKLAKPLGVEYEELMQQAGHLTNEGQKDERDSAEQLIEYLDVLELTDEEIYDRMTFKVDDMILTKEEFLEFISFVRYQRSKKKQQPAALSKSEEL